MSDPRIRRGDGVFWANFHPCLHGAAGQPNYWGLAFAISAKSWEFKS